MQISRYAANHGVAFTDLLNTEADEGCDATDGPPKIGPPDHLRQNMLLWMVPRTMYGCHRWSPGPSVAP